MKKETRTDKRMYGYTGSGTPPKKFPNIQSGVMKPNQGNTNTQQPNTSQKK